MSSSQFPPSISLESKEKISKYAELVYKKDIKNITKEEILHLIKMDMASSITKMTVSASGTRPTGVQYATNNYFASLDVDLNEVSKTITDYLGSLPEDKILDSYFVQKNVLYNFIRTKHESLENYLRDLLDSAMKKDNCPRPGRSDKE